MPILTTGGEGEEDTHEVFWIIALHPNSINVSINVVPKDSVHFLLKVNYPRTLQAVC